MSGTEITTQIEVYDFEILAIECVLHRWKQDWTGRAVDLENARKALIGSFEETRTNCTRGPGGAEDAHRHAGYVVDVLIWSTNVEGVIIPEVVIKDRIERVDNDPDRMVHEVTNDVLNLGTKGVIKTSDGMMKSSGGLYLPGQN